jgi:hypothetical protein
MLRAYLALIDRFVSGSISADEFEREFLALWRQDKDEHELSPGDKAIEVTLISQLRTGEITETEFSRRFHALVLPYYKGSELQPFTPQSAILDELFYDVDAYVGDPDLFEEGDLDAKGLREAARTALDQLLELQAERDRSS